MAREIRAWLIVLYVLFLLALMTAGAFVLAAFLDLYTAHEECKQR